MRRRVKKKKGQQNWSEPSALKGTISARLRVLRLEAGMSQERLAVMAGVTPSCISVYELARQCPTPETRAKLARALQVPVAALLEGSVPYRRADYKGVGDTLRFFREKAKLTVREAAKRARVCEKTLRNIEANRYRVHSLTVQALSRAYGVPFGKLVHVRRKQIGVYEVICPVSV